MKAAAFVTLLLMLTACSSAGPAAHGSVQGAVATSFICHQPGRACDIQLVPLRGPALTEGYFDPSSGLLIRLESMFAGHQSDGGRCYAFYSARLIVHNTRQSESGADLSGITVQRAGYTPESVDPSTTFMGPIGPSETVVRWLDLPVHSGSGLVSIRWADKWNHEDGGAANHTIAVLRVRSIHPLCNPAV